MAWSWKVLGDEGSLEMFLICFLCISALLSVLFPFITLTVSLELHPPHSPVSGATHSDGNIHSHGDLTVSSVILSFKTTFISHM